MGREVSLGTFIPLKQPFEPQVEILFCVKYLFHYLIQPSAKLMTFSSSSKPIHNSEAGLQKLTGLVERVTFHSEESGYCVIKIKVKGERELATVVGHTPAVSPGEFVSCSGDWIYNREYGRQFQSVFLNVYPPATKQGIEKYLGSGMVKGIGPTYASRLVKQFGEKVFDIIEQNPERLKEVEGIGPKRFKAIVSGWADQKIIRNIMIFLHSHKVSTAKSVRIFKKYGENAVSIITQNPYILAKDIKGIGFRSADTIALNMGIPKDSILRARAGISYVLSEASSNLGHACLPKDELIKMANELLEMPEQTICDAIEKEIEENSLVSDDHPKSECLYLPSLFYSEVGIASSIRRLNQSCVNWPNIDPDKAIAWVEKKLNINLAESQKEAAGKALNSKLMVITGGPGVGKTTLVNSILRILSAKKVKIILCAPTGRAAKRMSETTGCEAKTIHRLLEVSPETGKFQRNREKPLDCDLLVIDECSMVDLSLANSLLQAVPDHASVIFVGDVNQLPSVGPGTFLSDLIECGQITVIKLTEVFRQAADSWIIRAAHQINKGYFPPLPQKGQKGDFYFIAKETPEEIVSTIVSLVQLRLPRTFGFDPIKDIQVLCPMNRSLTGARSMNELLQSALNPSSDNAITKFGITFDLNDKVMQIENNYDKDVFNGDIGFINGIDKEEETVLVTFDGRDVIYSFDELDELVLCYATTIHKSQGSEYPVVIIPISTQQFMMLKRNLVYTGVTRGKKLVVVVGQKKALFMAIKDNRSLKRWSGLKMRLEK